MCNTWVLNYKKHVEQSALNQQLGLHPQQQWGFNQQKSEKMQN